MPPQNQCSGHTFLEVMLVSVMIVLLSMVAIPSYKSHVLRSQRALSQGMLLDLASKQEAQALRKGRYATALSALVGSDHSNASHFFLNRQGQITKTLNGMGASIYKVELLNASENSFLLRATALGEQAKDKACAVLTLASSGEKGAQSHRGENPPHCW